MSAADGWRPPEVRRLPGGLTVGLIERRQTPVVTTVLCYRAGAGADPQPALGVAHFLEHMMFKGSSAYGPGEVDRLTQRHGGYNNAYTGHDATLYQFGLAADRWREALAIEADRMAGLRLEEREIAAERAVILEELGMIEDDPWDALELAVTAAFYGDHPYGRPVLGRRESLAAIGREELAAFHRDHYHPGNAVLLIAGDVGEEAFEIAAESFAGLAAPSEPAAGGASSEPGPAPAGGRVERRRGELARLLVALPAPPAAAPGYAALRVVLTALAGGRSSRLHELLVEERRLCSAVGAEIGETRGPGIASLACELLPGAEPAAVEELVLEELQRAADDGLGDAETRRARRQLAADWAFGRESVGGEALTAATAVALFSADTPRRHLEEIETVTPAELAAVAAGHLAPASAVIGWSYAASGGGR